MTRTERLQFLLRALEGVGRIAQAERAIYLDFDVQLSPVHVHDLEELKREYLYRVQYEIPCDI